MTETVYRDRRNWRVDRNWSCPRRLIGRRCDQCDCWCQNGINDHGGTWIALDGTGDRIVVWEPYQASGDDLAEILACAATDGLDVMVHGFSVWSPGGTFAIVFERGRSARLANRKHKDAGQMMVVLPHLDVGTLRTRVDQALRRHPEGLTDWETTARLGLPERSKPSVAKRRQELGALDTGLRRPSPSGNECVVWALDESPSQLVLTAAEGASPMALANDAPVPALNAADAREITDRIKTRLQGAYDLLITAYQSRAWEALGYPSWDSYCAEEFVGMIALPAEERLTAVAACVDAGLSVRAISATGIATRSSIHRDVARLERDGDISTVPNRDSRDIERTVVGVNGKTYRVPRKKAPIARDPASARTRVKRAKEMAAEGYTSRQIGTALGIVGMTQFRKKHGIDVPADAVIGKQRRLDPNRIVEETVNALEADVTVVGMVEVECLDPSLVDSWVTSLNRSLRSLRQFHSLLKGVTRDHQQ